jgi:drug/metabolite transporter (DMT)-like permease
MASGIASPLFSVTEHRRGRAMVALAAVAWSTAGILQRELSVAVGTQLAGRAFFAVFGLVAYVAVSEHGAVLRAFRAVGRGGLAVATLMAISSGSFIIALNHSSVANVLFMQALAPILAAVLGTVLGEPVSRRTWLAMVVALAGVGLMVGGPGHPSLPGISLSLLMTASFAGTLVITRTAGTCRWHPRRACRRFSCSWAPRRLPDRARSVRTTSDCSRRSGSARSALAWYS